MQVKDHTDNENVKSSVDGFAKSLFNTYKSTRNRTPITETTFFPSIKCLEWRQEELYELKRNF